MAVYCQNSVCFDEAPVLHQIMFFRYCSNRLSLETMSSEISLVEKELELR